MSRYVKLGMLVVLVMVIVGMMTGCVPGDGTHDQASKAGFFWGVWHGWIAPLSLILQLFGKDVSIYETNNVGTWYDFGFYISVISGFGGISLTRKKYARKSD